MISDIPSLADLFMDDNSITGFIQLDSFVCKMQSLIVRKLVGSCIAHQESFQVIRTTFNFEMRNTVSLAYRIDFLTELGIEMIKQTSTKVCITNTSATWRVSVMQGSHRVVSQIQNFVRAVINTHARSCLCVWRWDECESDTIDCHLFFLVNLQSWHDHRRPSTDSKRKTDASTS